MTAYPAPMTPAVQVDGTTSGTSAPTGSAEQPTASGQAPARLRRQLSSLAFDLGAPTALYYLLHSAAGASNLVALTAGALLPALGATYTLVTKRQVDTVALLMVATMVTSIAVALFSHDPRFLLAKDGLLTGVWGAWFVATIAARRPAAFVFARPLLEGRRIYTAGSWDVIWDAEPRFRRIWRVASVMWGVGLLADAATRVVMSYTLPVPVVPGLSAVLWPVTFVVLQVVSNVYYQIAGLHRILGARWPSAVVIPALTTAPPSPIQAVSHSLTDNGPHRDHEDRLQA